jgi:hypothetical protein
MKNFDITSNLHGDYFKYFFRCSWHFYAWYKSSYETLQGEDDPQSSDELWIVQEDGNFCELI